MPVYIGFSLSIHVLNRIGTRLQEATERGKRRKTDQTRKFQLKRKETVRIYHTIW